MFLLQPHLLSSFRTWTSAVRRGCHSAGFLAFTVSALGLAGCATGLSGHSADRFSPAPAQHRVAGSVYGGQQPIVGGKVFLYATGTSGYGSASTSLISSNGLSYVVTDAGGGFDLTGTYNCPSATSLVYVLEAGGDPGAGENPAVTLMAALGNCAALKANAANIFISVNEVSTVAAVYALAPFMAAPTSVGAPASNLTGLVNAFAEVPNLVSLRSGLANTVTPAGNGLVPAAKINTLADYIAVCVNSDGATSASSLCGQVFSAATVGGVAPTETVSALQALALNPALNVSAVLHLVPPQSPFQPVLTAANDLSLSVVYSGGGLSTPQGVAIDADGNAWVPNAGNTLTVLSAATGAFLSGAGGLTHASFDGPTAVALDTNGVAWVSDCGTGCTTSGNASSVTKVTQSAGTYTFAKLSDGTLNGAYAVSVDAANNVWVGNALGSSVTKFNNAGVVQSGTTGYRPGGVPTPASLTADASGNVWVLDPAGNTAALLNASGTVSAGSYTGAALNYPVAAAMDASNRLWVVNRAGASLTLLSGGAPSATLTAGGLTAPTALAVDGQGSVWVANGNGTVSAFRATGEAVSPTGLKTGAGYANGVAIDRAGSVWVSSCGSYCTGTGTDSGAVVQMLGAASPVVTPLALAAKNNQIATRP